MSDMGLVDIGANLLNGQFRDDLDAVLARARSAGLGHIMVTATNVPDSADAIELCRGPADLSCTVGVHPHDAAKTLAEGGDWVGGLRALAAQEPVCAIGEAGLDFYRNFSPPEDQHAVFDAQILLAAELGLPLFVHDRDSGGAVYDALMSQAGQLNGVVIHCFTGDEADLRRYLVPVHNFGFLRCGAGGGGVFHCPTVAGSMHEQSSRPPAQAGDGPSRRPFSALAAMRPASARGRPPACLPVAGKGGGQAGFGRSRAIRIRLWANTAEWT